ncbi:MAG: hypothetical protein F2667_14195 [Actinobacteria bacterium]|uniref:Unannotated protein n=1 Tax=freshwater metagenome TaxID=449393 RepID=A0A6J6SEC3_9ZZZZ|nr:hypothetical protein [Actinomycetota bacterium]
MDSGRDPFQGRRDPREIARELLARGEIIDDPSTDLDLDLDPIVLSDGTVLDAATAERLGRESADEAWKDSGR